MMTFSAQTKMQSIALPSRFQIHANRRRTKFVIEEYVYRHKLSRNVFLAVRFIAISFNFLERIALNIKFPIFMGTLC